MAIGRYNMPDPNKCKELMAHILSSFETLGDMKCRYTRERWDARYLLKELELVEEEELEEEEEEAEGWGLTANPYEEQKMWNMLSKNVEVAENKKKDLDLMKTNISKWQDKIKTDLKSFMDQGCLIK